MDCSFEDRPAADVWFLLLGELHKDPVRFLSEEEIWQSLGTFRGFALTEDDRALFSVHNNVWLRARAENDASVLPCRLLVEAYFPVGRRALSAKTGSSQWDQDWSCDIKASVDQSGP